MHTLGSGQAAHEAAAVATQGVGHAAGGHAAGGHAATHATHGAGHSGDARLMAHDKRLRDAGPDATCVPSDPGEHSGAHCVPAPGALAPVPPAVVVLDRSDALPPPPAAAPPRSVLARAPTPDLVDLSVSRT
ncbi:hypothetical protein [Sinomonas mesophila]|uniref:hypothetical protein n=1 Tax=Sinomonas mesophila TaxID=1531955 RepID=UPI00111586A4|nr:hypothetical protein [Sinomonas mesophila]